MFATPQVQFSPQFDVEDASVDAVILADVITHVYRPFEHLARIRDALKPGGILFVVDHNNMASPMVRRVLRKEWPRADTEYRTRRPGGRDTYGMTAAQADFWAGRPDRPPSAATRLWIRCERSTMKTLFILVISLTPSSTWDSRYVTSGRSTYSTSRRTELFLSPSGYCRASRIHVSPAFEVTAVRV